jgi:hypothetical protein
MQTANPRRDRQLAVARAFLGKYRDDPVAFAADILGVRCWRLQAEILRLAARHNRVSVRSGHKCGKSKAVAILALWWVATRSEARVVLLAPSYRQIAEIVWREIKETHRNARVPLGGEVFTNPEQGIRWRDGRQIFGFSTDSKERVAGFSGNILYVLDEASGIPDEVHEVVSTNPGGTVVMISNPTRTSGVFYDSHNQGAAENGGVWATLAISSEAAADENKPIPGFPGRFRYKYLANAEWIEARKREFGEGSPYYDIRVRGEFARQADNAVIPSGLIDAAVKRWDSADPDGRIELGVDVARFGADDSGIVWRRGHWASEPITIHGFDTVAVANRVRRVCDDFKNPGERPLIRVDTSNGYGAGVADILRQDDDKDVIDVSASESATDRHYVRMRDQLWFSMGKWLKAGGSIAPDKVLIGELKAPTYKVDERGRQKVESKDDLKKRLRRSPDRADALALAVFEAEPSGTWDSLTTVSLSSR